MDLKEIVVGRINHSTKSVIAAMFLVSLCALFCLLAGCEEGMVEARQPAAGPDLTETVNADIETIAKAAENTLAEPPNPEPDLLPEPEEVAEPEAVMVISDEIAKADPAAGILAETIDPEPESAFEEQPVAEPVKEIGLAYPIPAKSLDMTQDETDSAADLDKMHIADAPLGDNADPLEHQEIQVQKPQVAPEATSTKGFADKYFGTTGSAVLRFTVRHYIILLLAVVCIAAWRTTRKKKQSSDR
jgi:hypothetical protein